MTNTLIGLITLPRLSQDAALFATLILLLASFVLGARAYQQRQAMVDRATAARRLAAWLERDATVSGWFASLRGRAKQLGVDAERALWALPRFDDRAARAQSALTTARQLLHDLRGGGGQELRAMFQRIRGTLNVLGRTAELRRKFPG